MSTIIELNNKSNPICVGVVRIEEKVRTMKKVLATALFAGLLLASSNSFAYGIAKGTIYSSTITPGEMSTQTSRAGKCGQASCDAYWFGIVQLGDCSYQAAMKNGGITQVHYQDTKTKGWFWKQTMTTRVFGE